MPASGGEFAPRRFSTRALPERDRIPTWREEFGRNLLRLDIEPLSESFHAEATLRALPGLRTFSLASSPVRFDRTRTFTADGDDSLGMVINLGGSRTLSQRGRDVVLGVGDAALLLHQEPAALTCAEGSHLGLVLSRSALAARVHNLDDATMQVVPRGNEPLRLLASYLEHVREEIDFATPELCELVVTHVHDLAALALGATRDAVTLARGRGVRAARLRAVKADILGHLTDRALSLDAVAARHGISSVYVRKLFADEGSTFTDFVLGERLARAHRLLGNPRCDGRTISDIAFACGFGDLSYFNRVFRRRYGATPSEIRADSNRGGRPPHDIEA
jgi:AraC-like DNA-binding protein